MQMVAFKHAGAERIWTETMSGARDDRPELTALLDYARRGDVLMVWRLDRLGRSLSQPAHHRRGPPGPRRWAEVAHRGDRHTTRGGRLIFHVCGAVAKFERAIAAERTAAGAAARAAGRHPGRPGLTADTIAAVHALDQAGTLRSRTRAPRRIPVQRVPLPRSAAASVDQRRRASTRRHRVFDGLLDPDWGGDQACIDQSVFDPFARP